MVKTVTLSSYFKLNINFKKCMQTVIEIFSVTFDKRIGKIILDFQNVFLNVKNFT